MVAMSRFSIFGVLTGVVAVSFMGCAVDDGLDEAPEGYVVEAITSCSARLERYPVNGPHNGGWDHAAASTFRCPPHSLNNTDFYRGRGDANHPTGHLGNDIFGRRGTPIVAARSGVVDNIANTSVGGRNVTIRDDCGWYYYYAHLDSVSSSLAIGRRVAAGTPIGTLGDTGSARGTTPHLHFSVFPGAYRSGIDPFPLLRAVEGNACTGAGPVTTPPTTGTSFTCHSATLGRVVTGGTCVQARSDSLWYQCNRDGWIADRNIPSTRRSSAGVCTSYHPLR
jgi:hypothetical protein